MEAKIDADVAKVASKNPAQILILEEEKIELKVLSGELKIAKQPEVVNSLERRLSDVEKKVADTLKKIEA